MITVLLAGAVVACVACVALVVVARSRWRPAGRPDHRRAAADPYAEQRKPDKLNPGLGSGCASGGGG